MVFRLVLLLMLLVGWLVAVGVVDVVDVVGWLMLLMLLVGWCC